MSAGFNWRWGRNWTANPHLQGDYNAMVAAGMTSDQVAAALGAPNARVLRTYVGWRRRNKGDDFSHFPRRFVPRGKAKSAAVVPVPVDKSAAKKKPLCLKCRRSFQPTHRGNFICPACTRNSRGQSLSVYEGLY